jgi:hypothetical protein
MISLAHIARGLGLDEIELNALNANNAATEFHTRLGFTRTPYLTDAGHESELESRWPAPGTKRSPGRGR